MITATKIRIYPNVEQVEKLAKAFGCARWYWNNSLAETQKAYKETGKGLGQFDLNARLPSIKKEFEWLSEVHSQVLQSVSLHLSRAFINFFERRAKFPQFKSKYGKQSIQYPQGVKILSAKKIFFPKIGNIEAVVHREISGKIKTVTVSKTPTGKYFASILSETEVHNIPVSYNGKILGIDVGINHIAVTSDGSKFENPSHLRKSEINLKRKQQKLSRKKNGSKSRNKARLLVAKAHEKTANSRKDWLHKLSRRLVDKNQVIAVEDLSVKNMMKNENLSKAIGDAGWGMFCSMLKYKCERDGKGYIEVNRFFPSSKTCNNCLHLEHKMPLSIRSWICSRCGEQHDRDVNASKNIRDEASRMIAAGTVATAVRGNVRQRRGRKISTIAIPVENGSSVI